MKKFLVALAVSLGSLAGPLAWNANAQVVINGSIVEGETLMILDYLMGQTIPDGYYWLDEYGNWGYEGFPIIQGNIFAGLESSGSSSSGDMYSGDASLIHGDNGCVYFSSDSGSASLC